MAQNLESLPLELIVEALLHLELRDLLSVRRVSVYQLC